MNKQVIKRYSKAFKLQVVREYEAGMSVQALRDKYGIRGSTIQGWLAKYAQAGLRHKLMVIQSPTERDQVKALKQRASDLEKVVAQLTLDKLMLSSTLEVAEHQLGLKFKKSGAARSSRTPGKPAAPKTAH